MWRPRFRSDYVPVRLPDGPLVVLGETRSLLVDDPVAADLADQLDGAAPLADVVARLATRHPVAAVATALARLRDHGLLTSGPAHTSPAEAAGWDARGVPPEAGRRWMAGGPVTVVYLGAPRVAETADALRALGLAVTVVGPDGPDPGPDDAQVLVLPSSMLDPRLASMNDRHLAAGRAWTLARPHGNVVFLGPHLVPGRTGCWACLRQRWQENEQVNAFLGGQDLAGPLPQPGRAVLPGLATTAAGLLAAELAVLAVRGTSPRLTGRMVALDTRDLSTESHQLVRQPQCPACGDPDLVRKAEPRIDLPPSGAQPSRAGDSRTREPAETYAALAHHVSRYLGVVSRLTPLEATDNGVTHTYSAGHNFAQPRELAGLRRNLRGQSGGKGRTDLQARMSAIGEAVERYCGVWRGDRPVHRATYRQLGPDRAVHLRELLLFSDRQYADRDRLNRDLGHLHRVPRPLPDDVELDWTTGWSLTRQTPRELPAAYCWYGHPELTGLGGVLGRLERLRGRRQPVRGDPAGLLRTRGAGQRRPVVVPPLPDARRGPRLVRRPVDHCLRRPPRHRPEPRAVGPRSDRRPRRTHVRRGVPAGRRRDGGRPGRLRRAPGRAGRADPGAHRGEPVPARRARTHLRAQPVRRRRPGHRALVRHGAGRRSAVAVPGSDPAAAHRRRPPDADHRRRGRRRAPVRTPGGAGRPGGDRRRPVSPGRRPGRGEGRRAGPAALLAPARPRSAVGRAGPPRQGPAGRRRDVGQPAERVLL
ncbi:LOW QUALITY PROTEIN: fatty acid binding protein, partial [Micromonospora sp. M42]